MKDENESYLCLSEVRKTTVENVARGLILNLAGQAGTRDPKVQQFQKNKEIMQMMIDWLRRLSDSKKIVPFFEMNFLGVILKN